MDINDKIFISYSWDNKKHIKDILNLSNSLRKEGIDCEIDQYVDSPSQGWPRWTDKQIREAKYVLCVCTENYYRRFLGETKDGSGVKWEGYLIFQYLYNNITNNTKFIPIILKEEDRKFVPEPLQGFTIYNLENKEEYDNLYYRLCGYTKTLRPKLGQKRPLPEKEVRTNPALYIDTPINIELWNNANWRGVVYVYDIQNLKSFPPSIGIVFGNKENGRKIFVEWKDKYGNVDSNDELRIALIEGSVEGESDGYYVHIGYDIGKTFEKAEKSLKGFNANNDMCAIISRIHRMTPDKDSINLSKFKECFEYFKRYSVFPCYSDKSDYSDLELIDIKRLSIEKKEIFFRNISEIEAHDIDACVLPQNNIKL